MAASEQTKLQINYSAKNGLMVNVYGDSQAEIEALLTNVQDLAPLILSVENTLKSGAPTAAVYNPAPVAPAALAAAPAQGGHTCRHGVMRYQEGVGAKGPWKGFMCASPKGTPIAEKCSTIWVR